MTDRKRSTRYFFFTYGLIGSLCPLYAGAMQMLFSSTIIVTIGSMLLAGAIATLSQWIFLDE